MRILTLLRMMYDGGLFGSTVRNDNNKHMSVESAPPFLFLNFSVLNETPSSSILVIRSRSVEQLPSIRLRHRTQLR